ncbi:MAG TPA: hypothetical protein VLT84_00880 [Acidobacteriota bacterium]|nr:hypothetical protein [Acidobacteriota bacterium]
MTRKRSPNYPSIPLDEAVDAVEKLWKKEHGTAVPPDVAAQAIGFSSLSGPSRSKLAALKQYGLLEGRGDIAVSDLAKSILVPKNPTERQAAIRRAALEPELFRDVHESYAKASDDAIMSYLVRDLDFSQGGARAFIVSYRKTVSYAKLTDAGTDLGEDHDEEGGMEPLAAQPGERLGSARPVGLVRSFSWPLSADVTAEVRIIGAGKLSKTHFESLKDYLSVAARMVPESAEEREEESEG